MRIENIVGSRNDFLVKEVVGKLVLVPPQPGGWVACVAVAAHHRISDRRF